MDYLFAKNWKNNKSICDIFKFNGFAYLSNLIFKIWERQSLKKQNTLRAQDFNQNKIAEKVRESGSREFTTKSVIEVEKIQSAKPTVAQMTQHFSKCPSICTIDQTFQQITKYFAQALPNIARNSGGRVCTAIHFAESYKLFCGTMVPVVPSLSISGFS